MWLQAPCGYFSRHCFHKNSSHLVFKPICSFLNSVYKDFTSQKLIDYHTIAQRHVRHSQSANAETPPYWKLTYLTIGIHNANTTGIVLTSHLPSILTHRAATQVDLVLGTCTRPLLSFWSTAILAYDLLCFGTHLVKRRLNSLISAFMFTTSHRHQCQLQAMSHNYNAN